MFDSLPSLAPSRPAVFFDKDGTLLDDVPYNVDPAKMRFARGAADALALLARYPLRLFVVSNQSGVALGRFAHDALERVEAELHAMFASCGATLSGFYACPHHPHGSVHPYARACDCRKPAPGLLLRAAHEHGVELASSWMVGDILDDVEAGQRAGCRTILADCGNETEWQSAPERVPYAIVTNLRDAAQMIADTFDYEHPRASGRPFAQTGAVPR
ncbi:D,D-heptose 1,7-bisphosphate phosphatase [Paraburkholderia caballeronis]|uniref:D-glycero-alpha-D-manno-heptose-1,7-bisphosphate 7-phosphatase n=1 Tax=Paraburkholderia caballeronis TaxID=416943 RepID=UPI0010669B5E|nr:HAD-IIIA family hydrolase [Paraburkholderia caballeronis]TDV37845.1 D,D-heptose 1,7-bisphosphate phosphatase [Paraburkholderia caballeronis]